MRLFAWCDSPTAPTGFGRSARHILHAFKDAGFEIIQLAVNQDPSTVSSIPWKVYLPLDRGNDPYGLVTLAEAIRVEQPDLLWSTFDPEVPWRYTVPGVNVRGRPLTALDFVLMLRQVNPGFRTMGWFPVDGGPLSNMELAVLGAGRQFDVAATMSPHVHDLIAWTMKLRGQNPDLAAIAKRLEVIPHGVDLEKYPLPTEAEKKAAKVALGLPPDAFVIGQVERNQQRKQNFLGLHVMEEVLKRTSAARGKVVLYQHMIRDEDNQGCRMGFDLPELAWRYGLKAGTDVFWPPNFLTEEMMPKVYAALDAFLSTSAGEGFQYPAFEALACGVPLVVPNSSSRKALLAKAPNVDLYRVDEHQLVLRGAYNRRMDQPDPRAAAEALTRLIRKGTKHRHRVAGREFVAKGMDHRVVAARWVEIARQQAEELKAERRAGQIAVPEDVTPETRVVTMHQPQSIADLIQLAPVLRALRERGHRVHLRVPYTHLDVARLLDSADALETRATGKDQVEIPMDQLFLPRPTEAWLDPRRSRTEVMAEAAGITDKELKPYAIQVPESIRQSVRAKFLDAFGVDPTVCVGLSLQDPHPHRALPDQYLPQLCEGIKALGLTPVLLGGRALNVKKLGVIDLTGHADASYEFALCEQLGAVVAADNDALHYAAAFGTPVVGCFNIVTPETRLRWYAGACQVLTAELDAKGKPSPIGGETYPAGYATQAPAHAWGTRIKPGQILAALRTLLGVEAGGPKVMKPGAVVAGAPDFRELAVEEVQP